MAAEGQSDSGEGSALGEHLRDLGRQVGCGSHQHLAQVASPRGGLLRGPATNATVTMEGLSANTQSESHQEPHTRISPSESPV